MKRTKEMRIRIALWLLAVPVAVFLAQSLSYEDWQANIIPPEDLQGLTVEFPKITEKQKAQLDAALGQPFHYLDEGGQSYVFISEDGNYVLKFFKFHRFRTQWFIAFIPNFPPFADYKEKHISRRKERLSAVYKGHQIAYELHKKESGLHFLQLEPTHSAREVIIFDRQGRKQNIDLGDVAFVLQDRGEMLSEVFSQLLDKGEVESVKRKIEQTLSLYHQEYLKGIYDTDHGVMHNIGFVGERPIHLDAGNFVMDERIKREAFYRNDLIKVANKIKVWVMNNYPQFQSEISEAVDTKVDELLGNSHR